MKGPCKSSLIRYGITTAIGIGLMAVVMKGQNFSEAVTLVDKYKILCDAFTVPGALLLLTGALIAVANEGAFDGVTYALKNVIGRITSLGKRKEPTYFEYVEEARSKGRAKGYGFIPLTGLVFMVIALLFLMLYNSVC